MAGYSDKAQPFLDSIAAGVFSSAQVRAWLIKDTRMEPHYARASILEDEQRNVRWASKPTKQPYWANYFCGRDASCSCRIANSRSLESDAIFFLRNALNRVLAIHVEFKHPQEPFGFGQPEGYPLRAACFAATHGTRKSMNAHDDWVTVIFCGEEALRDPRISNFQRVITHTEARKILPDYPRA